MRRRDSILNCFQKGKSPPRGQHNLNPEGTPKEKDYDHFIGSSYDVRMESFPKKRGPATNGTSREKDDSVPN